MSKLSPAQAKRYTDLHKIYMAIVDGFALDTREVAEAAGVPDRRAYNFLREMEEEGLVVGTDVNDESQGVSRRGAFGSLTWQTHFDTENGDDREAAEAAFHIKYPQFAEITSEEDTDMATATETKPAAAKTAKPKAAKPKAEPKPKTPPKAKLTNSQRRTIVSLVGKTNGIDISKLTPLSQRPFDYLVSVGLATKDGSKVKLTDAGKERAKEVKATGRYNETKAQTKVEPKPKATKPAKSEQDKEAAGSAEDAA